MPPPGVCLNIFEARQKQDGHGSISLPLNRQDYEELKEYCVTNGLRFIDEMFPPDSNSIGQGIIRPEALAQVKWLRPATISPNPYLVVEGISRFDFGQGTHLGNCWFLASIGALTFQNHVFKQVVPLEQSFHNDYCGIFHFRFWRFGRWVDVVIDDQLPTINGRLIFVHSTNPNEFWPALLEKAYAKLCGSYADMNSGLPAEALVDFTGGVHLAIQLSQPPPDLWELMCRAGTSKSLMSCGTAPKECPEKVLPNGLVPGHAYTITGVREVKVSQGKVVRLVRLWNPWGKVEWNGDWSDQSPLWRTVSSQDRQLCLSVDDDGEFWMAMGDFCKFYSNLDICSLTPEFLDGTPSCYWKTLVYNGRWVTGTTAGGCLNNKDTFWTNPQYRIEVCKEKNLKCEDKNILVSLMQKPDKRNRRLAQNFYIGFSVFKLTDQYRTMSGKFPASFFKYNAPIFKTEMFMNAREVMEFFILKPGQYLIVPSTFKPNKTASFILTIISKMEITGYENSMGPQNGETESAQVLVVPNVQEVEKKKKLFSQYSDRFEEVGAEQLQKLLNEKILEGNISSRVEFSVDACRSLVALMDTSITGKLNAEEFVRLWKKVVAYKEIFFQSDVSHTGTLSLSELRNAIQNSGMRVSDDMLNLMALRYGTSAGHMTLESFISLSIRLEFMCKIYKKLSQGKVMALQESEWMHLSMYT